MLGLHSTKTSSEGSDHGPISCVNLGGKSATILLLKLSVYDASASALTVEIALNRRRQTPRNQRHQIPRHHNRKQYVYPRQQPMPTAPPAVKPQPQRQHFHRQQPPQRMRRKPHREPHHRIALLYPAQQESERRQQIQHLQVGILYKQLIHVGASVTDLIQSRENHLASK